MNNHSKYNALRKLELDGFRNGFRFCRCGSNAVIAEDEVACIVCKNWELDDIQDILYLGREGE